MVAHASLTGANLHEPKGVASAASGQIYVANGAGSGTWRYLPHSSLYYANIGTGTTYTTPTAYTKIGPATTADSAPHDFTHSGTGRLTYTGATTMDFSISSSVTMKHSTGTGQDCYFAIYKNGVIVPGGEGVQTADSANYNHVNISAHISLATNDYIEIWCKVATGNIIVHTMNLEVVGRI